MGMGGAVCWDVMCTLQRDDEIGEENTIRTKITKNKIMIINNNNKSLRKKKVGGKDGGTRTILMLSSSDTFLSAAFSFFLKKTDRRRRAKGRGRVREVDVVLRCFICS